MKKPFPFDHTSSQSLSVDIIETCVNTLQQQLAVSAIELRQFNTVSRSVISPAKKRDCNGIIIILPTTAINTNPHPKQAVPSNTLTAC